MRAVLHDGTTTQPERHSSPQSMAEMVAVVVVAYNSERLLGDLVGSLEAGFGHVPWQLVVVDNASSDGSLEAARAIAPEATIVALEENRGYAGGINAGVAAAGPHSAILIVNPDVRLGPHCIPELLEGLRKAGTGIAVPRLLDAKGELIMSMRREPTILRALGETVLGGRRAGRHQLLGEAVTSLSDYDNECLTDWAEGSTQLVSKECWDTCGAWDESFFLYSEETEFGLRARDAGYATRYVPTAAAVHLEGGYGRPGLWRLLILNRIRLYQRRHGRIRGVTFAVAVLGREASRALAGNPRSRAVLRSLFDRRRWRETPGPDAVRD